MIKLKDLLYEGKFQMKGKHLYMPDGELSSIPGNNDRDGSYDKTFKNGNDLANWLNKEKAKYIGIDNR